MRQSNEKNSNINIVSEIRKKLAKNEKISKENTTIKNLDRETIVTHKKSSNLTGNMGYEKYPL